MSLEKAVESLLDTPMSRAGFIQTSAAAALSVHNALSQTFGLGLPPVDDLRTYSELVNTACLPLKNLDTHLIPGGAANIAGAYLPIADTPLARAARAQLSPDQATALIRKNITDNRYFSGIVKNIRTHFPHPTPTEIAAAVAEFQQCYSGLSPATHQKILENIKAGGDLSGVYGKMETKLLSIVDDPRFRAEVEKRLQQLKEHTNDPAMLPADALVKIQPSSIHAVNPYTRITASQNAAKLGAPLIQQPNYEIYLPRAGHRESKEDWQKRTQAMVDGIKAYVTIDGSNRHPTYITSAEIVGDGRVLLVPNHTYKQDKKTLNPGFDCFQTFLDLLNERAAKSAALLQSQSAGR